ncbi:hypothetical protein Slin14017_G034470 [Septoria linicola]|nr:hypothetical protein Slin14017_G034470 [Septoria linicola]
MNSRNSAPRYSTSTYSAQPSCPLLNLPAELRTQIYEQAITSSSPTGTITINLSNISTHTLPSSLLKPYTVLSALTWTCKQIHHETLGLTPSLNGLEFYLPLWPEDGSAVSKLDCAIVGRLRRVLLPLASPSPQIQTSALSPNDRDKDPWKSTTINLGRLPILRFEPAFRGWYNGEHALARLREALGRESVCLKFEVWNAETDLPTPASNAGTAAGEDEVETAAGGEGEGKVVTMGMRNVDDITAGLEDARQQGRLNDRDYACLKDLLELERIQRVIVGREGLAGTTMR